MPLVSSPGAAEISVEAASSLVMIPKSRVISGHQQAPYWKGRRLKSGWNRKNGYFMLQKEKRL